jgi:hypothetical protein
LSEGTVDLVANGHIDKYNPARHVFFDTAASVGDTFEMIMKLHVYANATNEGGPANAMSVYDFKLLPIFSLTVSVLLPR